MLCRPNLKYFCFELQSCIYYSYYVIFGFWIPQNNIIQKWLYNFFFHQILAQRYSCILLLMDSDICDCVELYAPHDGRSHRHRPGYLHFFKKITITSEFFIIIFITNDTFIVDNFTLVPSNIIKTIVFID